MAKCKPGECGNRYGRPKGSKNKKKLPDRLKKAAAEKVVVQEGGRKRKVTKIDIALTQTDEQGGPGRSVFHQDGADRAQEGGGDRADGQPPGRISRSRP